MYALSDPHMEFDLILYIFPYMTDLKWIFSNEKINSKSIDSVDGMGECKWENNAAN